MDLPEQFDIAAAPDPVRGRGPLADAVDGQDRRVLERRREEGAGRMGLMMLGVENLALEPKGVPHLAVHVKFVLQPHWCGLEKRLEAAGGHAKISLENALELQQRLVVEAYERQIPGPNPAGLEAVFHCPSREGGVAFLAREALLLRRRHDLPVA